MGFEAAGKLPTGASATVPRHRPLRHRREWRASLRVNTELPLQSVFTQTGKYSVQDLLSKGYLEILFIVRLKGELDKKKFVPNHA